MFTQFWTTHGEKITKICKGAVIAGLGAGISYAIPAITGISVPAEWIPLEVALFSVGINALRKLGLPIAQQLIFGTEV